MAEPSNDHAKAVSLTVPVEAIADAAAALADTAKDRHAREKVVDGRLNHIDAANDRQIDKLETLNIDGRLSHLDQVNKTQLVKLDKLTQVVFEGTDARTSLVAQVERLDERSVRVEGKVDKIGDGFADLRDRLDADAKERLARADAELKNHKNMVRNAAIAVIGSLGTVGGTALPYVLSFLTSHKN